MLSHPQTEVKCRPLDEKMKNMMAVTSSGIFTPGQTKHRVSHCLNKGDRLLFLLTPLLFALVTTHSKQWSGKCRGHSLYVTHTPRHCSAGARLFKPFSATSEDPGHSCYDSLITVILKITNI